MLTVNIILSRQHCEKSRENMFSKNIWYLGSFVVIFEFKNTKYTWRTANTCGGKETPQSTYMIYATREKIYKLERRTCWKVTRQLKYWKIIKSRNGQKDRNYICSKVYTRKQGIDYKKKFDSFEHFHQDIICNFVN